MKEALVLLIHLLTVIARLLGPGGAKAVLAENLLLKHQLLIVTRSRRRGPHLHTFDRVLLGLCSLLIPRSRVDKVVVAIRPSTLLGFRQCLVRRNYRALFSPRTKTKPGPKGPSEQLIRVIVELKCRNPQFGCPRMALIISKTFDVDIDKDVVRRVLAKRYRPRAGRRWALVAHLLRPFEGRPPEPCSVSM
jgi:putative transposase